MDKFPGLVTGDQHSELLLDSRIVRISVGLHAPKEIILDGQRVCFADV